MSTIPMSDINYLAQQSSERLNLILSGMTALMNDTDEKVSIMESQNWFQRMIKTVSGKNKMTQSEIEQNHDKLNAYMSEAIAELYNRDCIDHSVIISLGTQLNEIYADHLQLKNMLGSFVAKLNEKINSVDNFHMLTTEIDQGIYTCKNDIYSICNVLSQFDSRMLNDERKLDIIRRSLENQQILSDKAIPLVDYLMDVIEIPMDNAGKIYLELSTIRDNFMVDVFLSTMDAYYFLSDMTRKMKSKQLLVHDIIAIKGLNDAVLISTNEIYNEFLMSKVAVVGNLSINASVADIGDRKAEKSQDGENLQEPTWNASKALEQNVIEEQEVLQQAEQMFFDCKLDEAFEIFSSLAESGNGRAMYFLGEYYYHQYGHVARDLKESKKWRMKGYKSGDPLAALNACDYLDDDSVEQKQVLNNVFPVIKSMAESGDVYAQHELAELYFSRNALKQGIEWLKKAANEGYWGAMERIGDLYWMGDYVVQDFSEAMSWYAKGMEKESAGSFRDMALCYYYGNGVKEDNEQAKQLWLKAYELGSGVAAWNIAQMYGWGKLGDIDKKKKLLWAEKSAELGYKDALIYCGICYWLGKDVSENKEMARDYCKIASDKAYNAGTIMLGIMAMDEDHYSEANQWFKLAFENGSVVTDVIRELCTFCKIVVDDCSYGSRYDSSSLQSALHLQDEEVYMCHDDTILETGGNGFAITKSGIYYKEWLGSIKHVSFETLAMCCQIRKDGSFIYGDIYQLNQKLEMRLAYITTVDYALVIELLEMIRYIWKIYTNF